jgi:hypothetical protein
MKIIVTLFWAAAIGQVVGYIMTALVQVPDNPLFALVISLCFGLFILLFEAVTIDKKGKA